MTVRHLWCGLLLLSVWGGAAAQNVQLNIKGGTYFTVASGCALAIRNTDVHVEGSFDGPDCLLFFYGDTDQAVFSQSSVAVRELRLLKQVESRVVLHTDMQAAGLVDFGGGDLELNGYDLTVAGSGLQNENDASRVTAPNGGSVVTNMDGVNGGGGIGGASGPNSVDPGHLGAVIGTEANLGHLTVKRMHKPFLTGKAGSIQRSYFIEPQQTTGLHATLRLTYLDAELNGQNPATLRLWRSDDGITWTSFIPDNVSATGQFQFIEKRDIDSLGYWTLADADNPLGDVLSSFSAVCQDDYALIRWQTTTEALADHFNIERSPDGSAWTIVGSVAALNNSNGSAYSFKDNSPKAVAYYRIATVDKAGGFDYSPVFSGGCTDVALPLSVYPNPAEDDATLQIGLRADTHGTIQVVDGGGVVVVSRDCALTAGVNQVVVPLFGLAPGVYFLRLVTKQGTYHSRLMKK